LSRAGDRLGHRAGRVPACIPPLSTGHDPTALFTEGDALFQSMLEAIARARRRAWLESYIFAGDEVGWRFARALAERAAAGVDVRLHIDALGSRGSMSKDMLRFLRERGALVKVFRPWNWRRPLAYNRRDHRKLLVVDEAVAYLGGFNIHRESARSIYGESRWRDTHLALSGALVGEAAGLFEAFWGGNWRWDPPARGDVHSRILPNHMEACDRRLRCLYADMFAEARESIYLTTPYFVPDLRTLGALLKAARSGVDVRILVPRHSDVALARWAGWAVYGTLLEAGARIFEYLPRMLHAKTAVVDTAYATVGTANTDHRSVFLNCELNLFSRDAGLCDQLRVQFLADLRESKEVLLREWRQPAPLRGCYAAIGWLARKWL